ncbi:MAG: DinB family protein [Chloroflexi bacterium]|nr:DinB family protein [Chloroflexota bacterium]
MSKPGRLTHVVQPVGDCPPEIGRALWGLEDARRRTLEALKAPWDEGLTDWQSPHERHTVGTLLYHIAAIELDWLYAEVLESEFAPELAKLFPYEVRTAQGGLTPVYGVSGAAHLDRLAIVRSRVLDVYRAMSVVEYRRPRDLEHYTVTPEWVLHHLMQHEAEHRAEIASLVERFNTK